MREKERTVKSALLSIIKEMCVSAGSSDLEALTRTKLEFWQNRIMCFTEAYPQLPLSCCPGFLTTQDRNLKTCDKSKGGEIAELVKNRRGNPGHATVKRCFCSLDVEVLAVRSCPHYLPGK